MMEFSVIELIISLQQTYWRLLLKFVRAQNLYSFIIIISSA